jgi:hypothetical protein
MVEKAARPLVLGQPFSAIISGLVPGRNFSSPAGQLTGFDEELWNS